MQSTNEYFFNQTHDKLRAVVKNLLNNSNLNNDVQDIEKSQLIKFVKDIQILLESRIQDSEQNDMVGQTSNTQILENNFKDLWVLLELLLKENNSNTEEIWPLTTPNDNASKSVFAFFNHFSKHYPDQAQDIFFLNSKQGLKILEEFKSSEHQSGFMVDESEENTQASMENMPRMTSFNIISMIIKSSPWLNKLSKIVEYLREIQVYDQDQILERIETFQDLQFIRNIGKFDFSTDFLQGAQGQSCRDLYELISEVVLKKGISEAVVVLETIFGDLESGVQADNLLGVVLSNVLNGGLPFHDFQFCEFSGEDWTNTFGGTDLHKFKLLDYMRTKNFCEVEEKNIKASGVYGNHNWLLWQQSLYLSMKNSKTDSESMLFGVLCNDVTALNFKNDLSLEESLFSLFRSYFNNEVMRRYIVVRKILQKNSKILLFNEPCTVEEKFTNLTPSEILSYIYPGSSSHSIFTDKRAFTNRVYELAQQNTSWHKNIHFSLILDFLETKTGIKNCVSHEKLIDNYQKWLTHITDYESNINEESAHEVKLLVDNQNILMTLPLLKSTSSQVVDIIKPILLKSYQDYKVALVSKNNFFNLPLLLCCNNELDTHNISTQKSEHVFEDLVQILTIPRDSETLKILKEEIILHFSKDKSLLIPTNSSLHTGNQVQISSNDWCQRVYLKAIETGTALDQVKQNVDFARGYAGSTANMNLSQLDGINMASVELLMGENSNFGQALNMLVNILRNLMISRRFQDAAEFNHQNLNAFILKNVQKIHALTDCDEDLIVKSLLKEKELIANILDSIAKTEMFTSNEKLKNSKLLISQNEEVFGFNPINHAVRVHQDSFDSLASVLFLSNENWVFDFYEDLCYNSKRSEEVRRLKYMLIPFLANRIISVIGNCPDKKLQYDEIKKIIYQLKESSVEILKENKDIVNNLVQRLTGYMRVNQFAYSNLVNY